MPLTFETLRLQKPHLLEDVDSQSTRVRLSTLNAQALGKVQIPDIALGAETTVTLGPYQTRLRDQLDRATCYAFATCAAMEAAYRRDHGLILDLSRQYAFHVNKAFELFSTFHTDLTWQYENNSSVWGFQGGSDMVEKLARVAIPSEAAAPYLTQTAMVAVQNSIPAAGQLMNQEQLDAFEWNAGHIPPAARTQAVYRIKDWRALPSNPSVQDIKKVLQSGHEVVADIPNHCFLIIGYDDKTSTFIVKNSWGEPGFITYAYTSPVIGGRYILEVEPPAAMPQRRHFWLGRWHVDLDGEIGELVIRRFCDFYQADGAPTKLGSYYRQGKRYDVHGSIPGDGQTAEFTIADTTGRFAPGTKSGRPVLVHMFGDASRAAGTIRLNEISHGARLTRAAPVAAPPAAFSASRWLDSWVVDSDAGRGILRVAQLEPFLATFEDAQGYQHQLDGGVDSTYPHILWFDVPWPGVESQRFLLYHHTREDAVVSGITQWQGRTHGVVGGRYTEPYYPPFKPPGEGVLAKYVYAVEADGDLRWYRHDGARDGTNDWKGYRVVGWGWQDMTAVLPAGGDALYAIDRSGDLIWYRHTGFTTGLSAKEGGWLPYRTVGRGWGGFVRVFGGGHGVLYAVKENGDLRWYRHLLVETGESVDEPGAWAAPRDVATGWNGFVHVFSIGGGVIYGVLPDGTLIWHKHLGHATGDATWQRARAVADGWDQYVTVFGTADGVIYTVQPDGTLLWWRHRGYADGRSMDEPGAWEGPRTVGTGWTQFRTVLALLPRAPGPVR